MAALTIGMKVRRTLTFLTGLTHPQIAAALTPHGFSQAELAEGWELLTKVTGARLGRAPVPAASESDLVALDEWENKWFPIADAALARHFPDIRDRVFLNLSQTTGREVLVSVSTFLDRLSALADSEDEQDQAAMELLARRGLNAEARNEGDALLAAITSVGEPNDDGNEVEHELEDAMWTYYLEWSAIARTVIRNGRLLQRLGFRRRRPPVVTSADDTTETNDNDTDPTPNDTDSEPIDVPVTP